MLSNPRNELCGSRPSPNCGKAAAGKEANDAGTFQFHRGNGIGMQCRTSDATREVSPVEARLQLGSREGQARPVEMAERLVVATKRSNFRGAKGP